MNSHLISLNTKLFSFFVQIRNPRWQPPQFIFQHGDTIKNDFFSEISCLNSFEQQKCRNNQVSDTGFVSTLVACYLSILQKLSEIHGSELVRLAEALVFLAHLAIGQVSFCHG